MKTGVDLVSITTKDFQVKRVEGVFKEKGGKVVGEAPSPWGWSADLEPLYGPGYFLTRGKDSGLTATIDITRNGLTATWNPSVLFHPYDLVSDRKTLLKGLDMVRRQMDQVGIQIDLNHSPLSRVDLTKQSVIDRPISSLSSSFAMLKGKRMDRNKRQYPDGYVLGNNSRALVAYDKTKQFHKKYKKELPTAPPPDNMLRMESRWFSNRKIGNSNSGLGLTRLNDLLDADPEYLTDRYNTFLREDIFRIKPNPQLSFDWPNEMDHFTSMLEDHNGVTAFFRYIATRPDETGMTPLESWFLSLNADFGLMERFFLDAGVPRSTAYRYVNMIREDLTNLGKVGNDRGNETPSAILDNLLNIFAA